MRLLFAFLLAFATSRIASAQSYTISTFAGRGLVLPVNIPATSASLVPPPYSVAVDGKGNVCFPNGNIVLCLDAATGILTLVAGTGNAGFSGDDGLATSAALNQPAGLAFDSAGSLYIVDAGNNRVRRVSNGVITTVAGSVPTGGFGGFGGDNGPATSARLNNPWGIAVDSAGNFYIGDTGNSRIRKVSKGVITTVAGNGTQGFSGDGGPATSAQLYHPTGLALDSAGNLYIADSFNNRVRLLSNGASNGVITTVAGNGTVPPGTLPPGPGLPPAGGFGGDGGPATSAQLYEPIGLAVDSAGSLYIADAYNGRIRRVSNFTITTVAGSGVPGVIGDGGSAIGASLSPFGVAADSAGNLYIGDTSSGRIRKVSDGVITTLAGSGKPLVYFSGDNGPASAAQLRSPSGVALDLAGNLYIADTGNQRIRKVSNGTITTVAGGGTSLGDDGPATSARLNQPLGVAVDSAGNLYIADAFDNRIRKVSNGVITTVAGTGAQGFSGDGGLAISARLYNPNSVAVDSAGNLYIADSYNNRIREVSNGVIMTVAGNGVLPPGNGIPGGRAYGGFSGDGGPATNAQLSSPNSVAVDTAGNLYISDYDNYRVRKVSSGIISTVAGIGPNGGFGGFGGDGGQATSAQLNDCGGIAVDYSGNLYIADTGNLRIRRVSGGVIATIAGNGMSGSGDDEIPATAALLGNPVGLAVDSAGRVYTSDYLKDRVRRLTEGTAPSITPGGIVPVYSSVPTVQAGSWVSIYGTELANGTFLWNNDFPVSLGGTSVTIDNRPAFLWVVSPTQINLQVPDSTNTGAVNVAVTTASGTRTSTVTLAPQAPSFSLLGDGRHVAAEIPTPNGTGAYAGGTYDLVGPSNTFSFTTRPVKAGETLMLYGVGFGPTLPAVPAGKSFVGSAPTVNPVTVTVGGMPAKVTYSGMVQTGLYQINITVPAGPGGDRPLIATVNGVQTQPGPVVTVQ